ncbi:MAG: transcription-repair coupling factor [Lachnospiraceae bacterium]|nr:transcription-repair coupling factor [Lachnospiraceae bacterium]
MEKGQSPLQLTGVIDSEKCHLIFGLAPQDKYKVIVTSDDQKAREIYEDYKLYDSEVCLYPAKDVVFYSADIHGNAIVQSRMNTLRQMCERKDVTIVTTIDAGMDKILSLQEIKKSLISLKTADILDLDALKKSLVKIGYERCAQVEMPGQFSVRGGIIDIFPLTEEMPYRIELWDDEIDTIRMFSTESQRSVENVDEITIYPATEYIMNADVMEAGLKKYEKDAKAYGKELKESDKLEAYRRLKRQVKEFTETFDIYNAARGMESYVDFFYEDTRSFFDYFEKENAVFFVDEPARSIEKSEEVEAEFVQSMNGRLEQGDILPKQKQALYTSREIFSKLGEKNVIMLSTMDYRIKYLAPSQKYDFVVKSINPYNGSFELLVKDLKSWKKDGYRMILISTSRTRAKRMSENLLEYDLTGSYSEDGDTVAKPGEIIILSGGLHSGFEYPLIKTVVIAESDIFGAKKPKKKRKKNYDGARIHTFNELKVGDYVVHENHGLGIYRGIEKLESDGIVKDYIKIEYAGDSSLYVLATGLEVLQKYAAKDATKKPKLNKLNSVEWKRTKKRVRTAVETVAKELVELYAVRSEKEGFAFEKDSTFQTEFEEMFPYEETEDQLLAIEATKRDMESTKIMDRLICGDVGYGKTEIAIRAAFKAVLSGKQVAFLVPTTILAQQHYNTLCQRMKEYPVEIQLLSRFRTAAEQKKTIEKLKKGQVDIVVGTHRLLSKDISFQNLGLLVIDEEQRFGVTHKEKIKQMKKDVDVLALSATPIPRTLHMSLVGIRDMSVLEEPPVDRLPIQTYVMEHNGEIIREAIHRELARGGQVYYVNNRVNNIDEVTRRIQELVPEAVVANAHGQMSERQLEKIMYGFINGEIDVLVATTIIETGLDISNVNTIIVDNADRLGLSQLYQIRGRVGRSSRRAYAFLMYKRDKVLKEVAEKRLQAIKEFTDLGSGFKIAMRDLEIRGAGNLLGERQHGHMEAVGYDLYCKMLNEAVHNLKGEKDYEESFETSVDLDVSAFIPVDYISSEIQKLDMYKRIAEIESKEDFENIQDELIDRFGDMNASVDNLLHIALLKAMAHKAYITQIVHKAYKVRFFLADKAPIDVSRMGEFMEKMSAIGLSYAREPKPHFILDLSYKTKNYRLSAEDIFEKSEKIILKLTDLLIEGK